MAKSNVYQHVTDRIVAALEHAGEWSRPWLTLGCDASKPRNIVGRAYRGVNILLLWCAALEHGWPSGIWATYRAWQQAGAQVRRGERATKIVLWRPVERTHPAASPDSSDSDNDNTPNSNNDGNKRQRYLLAREYAVFNASQVDGWVDTTLTDEHTVPENLHEWVRRLGASIVEGSDKAFYDPAGDRIWLPHRSQFSSPVAWFNVAVHEHVHWTGHPSRLARNLDSRFGSEAYAMEELVAELGAAMIAAKLGVEPTVRDDHAAYVRSWLRVLRDDNRAVFKAATLAQRAADFLCANNQEGEATQC